MSKLPSKNLKSVLSSTYIIHVVDPDDSTDHASGSSFKANLGSLFPLLNKTEIITPAGTDFATATTISKYHAIVDSGADGIKGLAIPQNSIDYRCKLTNNTAYDIPIYPQPSCLFKYGTTSYSVDAPFILGAGNTFEFVIFELGKIRVL
jgi:hypothetical protein